MSNESTWRHPDVVREYSRAGDLQPAEHTVLEELQDRLRNMRMLDIGVGGGRTTVHFAPRVKEYLAIDSSPEMIEACRRRFDATLSFLVGDARYLDGFPGAGFDFVIFSYNGIDYMSHRDRLRVFKGIRRVARPGGVFLFSSHNIQDLQQFEFPRAAGPDSTTTTIAGWLRLRLYHNKIFNLKRFKRRAYAIVNDGAHRGRLRTYYVRPAEQLDQLRPFFCDIRVHSLEDREGRRKRR